MLQQAHVPTSPRTTVLDKIVLQQTHVPTSTLAAAGLDLTDITRVILAAGVGLDGIANGGVLLQAVRVPTMGDALPGATPTTSYKVAVSYSSNAVLGKNDFSRLVIPEDDRRHQRDAGPGSWRARRRLRRTRALSTPGNLTASDAKPDPGQRVTIAGSGYRNGESVAFTIDDAAVGSAIADSSGTATISLTVPADMAHNDGERRPGRRRLRTHRQRNAAGQEGRSRLTPIGSHGAVPDLAH